MSLQPKLTDRELASLAQKTIIITGGASGIGRATVLKAHQNGANVVIADVNKQAGDALVAELKGRAMFHYTDISNWNSILDLFEAAVGRFSRIDTVCANAGTNNWDSVFADELDESTGRLKAPTFRNLEINLFGTIHTAKAAVHYFSRNPGGIGQLVLTGSAASLIDTPPLHLYCAGKAGILGFMRSIRTQLIKSNATVNMIAPWMTRTPMLPEELSKIWGELPANTPDGVADALLLPSVRPEVNGKSFWVAGNQIVELEGALHAAQPQWMGENLSRQVDEGQRRMGIF
ncbi:uncharacterized protein APUU_50013A [Aspergillus puulaauensis]|uniref:NAD(P)-binding protein n=1 Tax=Aspergillus puulaauensis TaxID=1220207 RepID=A0A7R8ANV7_9EURO|nr:uncharacterized protein APUU_50013A [Aspergillus puulaauensis]BCS25302.1 hypothetical protein APUU_50013A [Aspergillus puulaauensis]